MVLTLFTGATPGIDTSWMTDAINAVKGVADAFTVFPFNALIGLTIVGAVIGLVLKSIRR